MIKSWKQLSEHSNAVEIAGELAHRQVSWLLDCIKRNQLTTYGKTYHFDQIHSVDDYRRRVPIVSYQDLTSYIDAIEKGTADCLFAGQAIAFERTSGTSSGQKLIPYSNASLHDFKRAILPWLTSLSQQYKITSGCAYWAISPAMRHAEHTAAGIPIGMADAAYLGEDLAPFFGATSAVPHWLGSVSNINDWQLATLYCLVSRLDLNLISVWSPTFLLTLLDALENRRYELETALRAGIEIHGQKLPPDALALQRLQVYYAEKNVRALWPDLKVISCWADASSKPFYDLLVSLCAGVPIQPKGLLLTEGIVTVPNGNNQTLLTVDSGFYEFLDDDHNTLLAHELCAGEKYEVVMTTAAGLYRYRTYDRVRCEGYAMNRPILRFMGRDYSSDMVGEKLTEEFVTACLEGIAGFSMLVPLSDNTPHYLVIVDNQANTPELVKQLETRLYANPHYAYARKLGQLGPLTALPLPNPLEIYLHSPVHAGTRFGDIKVPSLCFKSTVFDDYIGAAA